uniref:Putative disease resistance protein At5g45490 n=1 Tax=Anthurium amnicola TaxID=1678845 RepID=A0A1D1YPS2_9ARAE
MAAEMVHLLLGKFTDSLREEDDSTILFLPRFQELKWELEKKISPTMPLDTNNLLRELLYDLNDVLVECRTSSRRQSEGRRGKCLVCYSPGESWFRYRTKKRLRLIKQRILSMDGAGGMANSGVNVTARGGKGVKGNGADLDRWTSPAVDVPKIHGFTDRAMEMESLLIEQGGEGFRALGVVGMGGVGKTTLAQMVFNSPLVKRHFCPRLWVCMSQTSLKGKDVRKETLERVLTSLGVEEDVICSIPESDSTSSQSLAVLTVMLHLQLRGKRYLIVFDDMWSTDEWYGGLDSKSPPESEWGDRLSYGLPKGDGGGVIVTGRMDATVKGMVGDGDTRLLLPLESKEACWSVFLDAYVKGGRAVGEPDLMAMQVEIMDKCRGLPLAARTMGEIMSEIMSSSGSSRGGGSSSTTSGSLE